MSELIWDVDLDNAWKCTVTRKDQSTGILEVCHIEDPHQTILHKEVSLMYGSVFGPDIEDVESWQNLCLEAVDNFS